LAGAKGDYYIPSPAFQIDKKTSQFASDSPDFRLLLAIPQESLTRREPGASYSAMDRRPGIGLDSTWHKPMWILAIILAMAFLVVAAILLPVLIALIIGLIDRAVDLVWRVSPPEDQPGSEPVAAPPATEPVTQASQ
jgi:hypothetical protein